MRKLSAAAIAMVLAIALYFTLFWGFEALRMLTSPTYGLEEVWRSQFIFAIGHYLSLSPMGLIKLAAFFATLKLAVAAICAVHSETAGCAGFLFEQSLPPGPCPCPFAGFPRRRNG